MSRPESDAAPDRTASQLREVVKSLAGKLRPFPPFIDMTSIQAIEVEVKGLQSPDRGCVVVCPDGEFYQLSLRLIPGPLGVSEADQVEELEPLRLPAEEYIPYARAAIEVLRGRLETG